MKNVPRITTLFLATLLLFLVSSSCNDKNKKTYCEENPSGCQSVLASKEFFVFKVGSWWVYEEETTHERDSMYVTESYNNSNGYDFLVKIKSSLTDYEYHYWPIYAGGNDNCSESSPVRGKCIYIKRSKGKPGEFVGEDYCFFVNFKVNDGIFISNVNFPNNTLMVQDILSDYTLGSLSFTQSVKMFEDHTFIESNNPTNHYFARNVGLVRKELLDSNQVWNLVDYYIAP
ncbi:MAG: hypothetical protein V4604_09860 [Bacteroidota bacterium]